MLPVTGQDIGIANIAGRALIDELLGREGTTFERWIVLNLLATRGPSFEREALVGLVAAGTRTDAGSVRQLLAQLESEDLVRAVGDGVELSPAGLALFGRWRDAVARVTAEVYAPFDPSDLAITRRVLVQLTERINAWVAAAHAATAA
jgi:DNA-binding MarR family transcriptional regulator